MCSMLRTIRRHKNGHMYCDVRFAIELELCEIE